MNERGKFLRSRVLGHLTFVAQQHVQHLVVLKVKQAQHLKLMLKLTYWN